jgi:ribosomal protein L37AE/L43A
MHELKRKDAKIAKKTASVKPCPFCGGRSLCGIRNGGRGKCYRMCGDCGATIEGETWEEVTFKWNARARLAPSRATGSYRH